MKAIAKIISMLTLMFAVLTTAFAQDWPQWGRDPQHSSQINVAGQSLNHNLTDLIYDSSAQDEIQVAAQLFGDADLLVHYQVPLIDGNDVYMEFKSGNASKNTFNQLTGPRTSSRGKAAT